MRTYTPSPELIIIRGLPGSGKSTMAKKDYPHHLHYEPDQFFCDTQGRYRFDMQIWDKACEFTQIMTDLALARGENVVVTDVFPLKKDMEPYMEIAKAHDAEVITVICKGRYGNCHRVPWFVQKQMREMFEV